MIFLGAASHIVPARSNFAVSLRIISLAATLQTSASITMFISQLFWSVCLFVCLFVCLSTTSFLVVKSASLLGEIFFIFVPQILLGEVRDRMGFFWVHMEVS